MKLAKTQTIHPQEHPRLMLWKDYVNQADRQTRLQKIQHIWIDLKFQEHANNVCREILQAVKRGYAAFGD